MDSIVPEMRFDWLGQLPDVYRASQLEAIRRNIGPIDFSSSDAISKAAQRLAAAGDWESALKLTQLATSRETAEAAKTSAAQRGADLALWSAMYGPGKARPTYGGGQEPGPVVGPTTPTVAPPAASALPSFMNTVVPPGPQSAIEPSPSIPPTASLPPSPTEQLLARTEGPPPVPPPAPTQLAGPPPMPDTASDLPPPMAPTAPVPFAPQQPPALTAAPPPAVPGPTGPMPMRTPEQQAAQAQELRIGNEQVQLPPRAMSWPEFRVNQIKLADTLKRQNVTTDQSNYALEQAQRTWSGQPVQTFSQWQEDKANAPKRFEEVQRTYKYYQEKGQGAEQVIQRGELLQRILDDPRYVPGSKGIQPWVDSATRGVIATLRTAQAYGIPLPVSEDQIKRITDPVALRELVAGLHNQLVIAGLGGSLGNRISDYDAVRMASTVASLENSPGGAKLINRIGMELATRAKLEQGYAAQYRRENPYGGDAPGMDTYVQKRIKEYADNHPILIDGQGKLTPLGQKAADTASVAAPAVPMRSAPAPRGPQEGDEQAVQGGTAVFRNGRWQMKNGG